MIIEVILRSDPNRLRGFLTPNRVFEAEGSSAESHAELCYFSLISLAIPRLSWRWHFNDCRPGMLWNFSPFGFAVSSWLNSQNVHVARTPQTWRCVLVDPITWHTTSIRPIAGMTDFDLLIRRHLPNFPIAEALSPLVINKYWLTVSYFNQWVIIHY